MEHCLRDWVAFCWGFGFLFFGYQSSLFPLELAIHAAEDDWMVDTSNSTSPRLGLQASAAVFSCMYFELCCYGETRRFTAVKQESHFEHRGLSHLKWEYFPFISVTCNAHPSSFFHIRLVSCDIQEIGKKNGTIEIHICIVTTLG